MTHNANWLGTHALAGSFLAIPTGQYKASPDGRMVNTVYIYARNKWGSPALHLPGHPKVRRAVLGRQARRHAW